MTTTRNEMIETLKSNLKLVVFKLNQLKSDYVQVSSENKELLEKLKLKESEFLALELKYNTLKVAHSLNSSQGDSEDAKNKLNTLVREVDKCIALLNR